MDGGGGRQASMGMPAGSSLYALPGATFEPTADLEMSVECNNLDNMDCASSRLCSVLPLAPAQLGLGISNRSRTCLSHETIDDFGR